MIKYKLIIISNRRMLPKLSQSQLKQNSQILKSRISLKQSNISKASKGIEQVTYYEDKYQNELVLNNKLKKLLSNLKSNVDTNATVNQQENQIVNLTKQKRKWEVDVQHQAHILNLLISENSKLKEQVDSQRNKRAIYFNVYKNLEHQIHQWQSRYKNLLIESMKAEGSIVKCKQKFRKATRKIEKEIQILNQQIAEMAKTNILEETDQTLNGVRAKNSKKNTLTQQNIVKGNQPSVYLTDPVNMEKNNSTYQTHNSKKSHQFQLQYEIEQKSIQTTSIINRLKQISGKNELGECYDLFKSINEQIQYNFSLFKQEEQRQKYLTLLIQQHQIELQKIQSQNLDRKSTKVVNVEGQKQIVELNQKIREMQKDLEDRIGILSSQLSNQMLLHHCLRVRDDKKEGKKNLQKYLQQTKKQKSQCNLLLSPQEMHKRIIQNQTSAQ